MPRFLRTLLLPIFLAAALTLSACGSSSHPKVGSTSAGSASAAHSSQADASDTEAPTAPPSASNPIVARIAQVQITKAQLLHRMSIGSPHKNEVPVPPGFETCIAHLQASKRSGTASELQLKEACQEKYEILLEQSLSGLINEAWLINEAKAERISVDEAALARELKASRALFEKFGGFQKGLARNGRTPMDLKSELRLGQLSNQIYEHIEAKIPHLSESFVSEYYKAHKDQYKLPVRRDLRIVRTSSGAAAHHAKQQIRSGKSFAEVVKHLTVAQPFSAKEGFVKGLTHKLYAEPLLADAIFKAPLHVLSGPVKIPLGYYLFEVTRQIPAHQLTLAEATPQIKDQLPRVLHDQTLSGFVKAFKRKWALRTNCRAGYMVQGCREFKATEATVPSDPFVL